MGGISILQSPPQSRSPEACALCSQAVETVQLCNQAAETVHCATRQQKLQFRISLPARFRKTCQSLQQKIYASNSAPSNKMQIKLRPEGHNSDQFIFIIRGIG